MYYFFGLVSGQCASVKEQDVHSEINSEQLNILFNYSVEHIVPNISHTKHTGESV